MKYRKKPVIVEATQWFKNGDHPDDKSVMVYPDKDSLTQFKPFLSEGQVVRYYRNPNIPDNHICVRCGNIMLKHGWIDTLEGGHIVCPGDWIITGVQGEHYPCKPDIFEATYEKVEDEPIQNTCDHAWCIKNSFFQSTVCSGTGARVIQWICSKCMVSRTTFDYGDNKEAQ